MWAAKGYRSYRGRPPKGKIALAVVLVLVIVAAVAVIVLQEYLVYDADGNARLELPWQQDTEQTEELPQEPGEVDIVIQEPETPAGAKVLWLTDTPLTAASAPAGLEESGYDAVAVTMKGSSGSVYYDSQAALPAAGKTADTTAKALADRVKTFAKDVRDSYIDPPYTTDFAILFLPTEGLYQELTRRADVMDRIRVEDKVLLAGPSTLAALINALQMGFQTLAVQRNTVQVMTLRPVAYFTVLFTAP